MSLLTGVDFRMWQIFFVYAMQKGCQEVLREFLLRLGNLCRLETLTVTMKTTSGLGSLLTTRCTVVLLYPDLHSERHYRYMK